MTLTFDLLSLKVVSESSTCDVGYLCANFSLPIAISVSVLDLGPMYATDRQTDVKRQTASSLNALAWGGIYKAHIVNIRP